MQIFEAIYTSLSEMHDTLTARGYSNPYWENGALLRVQKRSGGGHEIRMEITCRADLDDTDSVITFTRHTSDFDMVGPLLRELRAEVLAQPEARDWKRAKWRERLAQMVEDGEALGFAVEYVQALRDTADALAENALPRPID